MPDKSIIAKLIERAPLAIIVIGVIIFIIGAAGGWPNPALQVNETSWRIALALMGFFLSAVGGVLLWRETTLSSAMINTPLPVSKYGIKIDVPRAGAELGETVEVSGSFTQKPPNGMLRLITISSDGKSFWPQEEIKEFDTTKNKWYARVNLGGQPRYGITIAVVLVGQPSQVLWDYYYRVGPQVGWWSILG